MKQAPTAPPQAAPPVLRDRARERAADRAAAANAPQQRGQASHAAAPSALGLGPGVPLPMRERRYFERRVGADLGGVRVHTETSTATRLGARAFAAGRDIGFAPGEWAPDGAEGRRLLGHELAHVVQQGAHGPAVQLEEAPKTEEAADVLEEGVKTVLEQVKKQEGVKTQILEPAKKAAVGKWDKLGTGEKIGLAGFGAGTYGLTLSAGLSDPAGRKTLSDVNLAAPLGAIPYSTLTDFRYVLPASGNGPTLFKASFSGDDLLALAHDKLGWFPSMTLTLDFAWSADQSGGVNLSAAKAVWGVMPGVTVQAGSGVGLDWKQQVPGPDGQVSTIMQSVPALPGASAGPAGTGVFVTVDLLKAPFVPAPVRAALGASPEKK
jgi:hypothetical protein